MNRPGSLLVNGGWLLAEHVARLVVSLFVGVLIARQLGPGAFGDFSFALAYASLFGIVAAAGLNRIAVRELARHAQDDERCARLVGTVITIKLSAASAMYLLALAVAWFAGQGKPLLIAIVAGMFVFNAADVVDLFFVSRAQARYSAMARSAVFAAVTLVRLALLASGAGVVAFALAALLEGALTAAAFLMLYRRKGPGVRGGMVDAALAASLLRESWPEIIAGFGGMLLMKIDEVMLGNMIGPEAVGVYSAAARVSEAWYFVPVTLVALTFPGIVQLRDTNAQAYNRQLHQLVAVLVILSYLAAAFATVFAETAIRLLYGERYLASASVLIIHIWCGLFVSLGLASGSWIVAEKRVRLNLIRNLIGASANIALNLALVPRWGVAGAAWATLLSLIIAYLLFDLFVPGMRPMALAKLRALVLLPVAERLFSKSVATKT